MFFCPTAESYGVSQTSSEVVWVQLSGRVREGVPALLGIYLGVFPCWKGFPFRILRCLLVPKQAGNRGERVSFAWVAGGWLGAQPTLFKGTVGSPPPFPGEVCGLFSVVSL